MSLSRSDNILALLILYVAISSISGCGPPRINSQAMLNQPKKLIEHYNFSKKYIKSGITVVYLTGSPYEIGLAHGKLCKNEILTTNKAYLDLYEKLSLDPQNKWLEVSKKLENRIPEEYLEEMRGIADGSEIEYEKILYINTLTTISMGNKCYAFAFIEGNSRIITVRQIDDDTKSDLYKNMILYIIKPQKGYGFAAILDSWCPYSAILYFFSIRPGFLASDTSRFRLYASQLQGPYIGFNLQHESYGTGDVASPAVLPAY
jgi:hypothetical protein